MRQRMKRHLEVTDGSAYGLFASERSRASRDASGGMDRNRQLGALAHGHRMHGTFSIHALTESAKSRQAVCAHTAVLWKGTEMTHTRRQRAIVTQLLIALAALMSSAGPAHAQDASVVLPDNATAIAYGQGWRCDANYREANGSCVQILVPVNAFLNNSSYGSGWECAHGYLVSGQHCTAVSVPPNAYLEPSGNGWRCNRQYRLIDGTCVVIEVPLHGYLDRSGDTWQCERGYRRADETCTEVQVPENAYLMDSAYGTGWACERGYREIADTCAAIQVPTNAYFVDSSYGPGWSCERGFQASDGACVAIDLPENAHIDFTGNDWECNRPYRQRDVSCLLP